MPEKFNHKIIMTTWGDDLEKVNEEVVAETDKYYPFSVPALAWFDDKVTAMRPEAKIRHDISLAGCYYYAEGETFELR